MTVEMISWWLIFFLTWPCLAAFNWTSTLQDRAVVTPCENTNVSLRWNFTTDTGETIQGIIWYFQAPGEEAYVLAHTEDPDGHFVADNTSHVELLNKAGLLVAMVTSNNTGRYSVVVRSADISGTVTTNTQTAQVEVAVRPSTTDDRLHVRVAGRSMEERVGGLTTGRGTTEPQLQLRCGRFASRGYPEVDVLWRTPSGEDVLSTNYTDGYFVLTLPRPVIEGKYTCRLSHNSSAIRCLSAASGLFDIPQLYSEELEAKVAIAETWQEWLIEENARLRQELVEENALLNNMSKQIEDLRSRLMEPGNLTSQVHDLQMEVFNQSSAIERLTSHVEAIRNCRDVQLVNTSSGVYRLQLPDGTFLSVYCDQTTDGGGWTVFQRRQNGDVDFYRDWDNYTRGFGDPDDEFWLGLDNLHTLTSEGPQVLRVDMEDWEDNHIYATYQNFAVGDSQDNYTMHIGEYKGNAGDSLSFHDNSPFSTWDHDKWFPYFEYCASRFHGAWWYNGCMQSNLNGEYKHNSSAPDSDGISWSMHLGSLYSLRFVEMKFRPQ